MFDTEGPYQVFLWYRLRKYQENTNQYHTEIPNRDTTLEISFFPQPLLKLLTQIGPPVASNGLSRTHEIAYVT